MLELFRVAASMVLDRSEYDRDVSEVDKSGKNLAENLSGYFEKAKKVLTGVLSAVAIQKVASGIWNLAKETSAAGDRIDKTSQALGMSRKAFQEWDYILAQSGASIDSMGMSMKTMNEAISKNSAETAVALSRLGLSAAKLQNLSPEQQFEELVKAFQKMPASAKKSEYAMLLFGRNAQSLMPLLNSASGSVDELRNRAHELGLIMSDEDVNASVAFGDALDDLNRVWTAVKQKFGAQMLPTLTKGLVNVANSLGRVTNSVAKAFKSGDWSGVFDTITTEVKTLLPKFIDTVVNLGVSLFQNADKIISLGFSIITGITAGLREHIPELVEKVPTIFKSMVDGIKELGTEAGNGIIDLINAAFGTNIPHLDKITWPTWPQVEKAFNDAWELIKTEATKVMKLVFGESEDGGIKWPSSTEIWNKIKDGLKTLWGDIRTFAKYTLTFVFGEDENGGIRWPTAASVWLKIKSGFTALWDTIKSFAKYSLVFVFGEDENGGIRWPNATIIWYKIKDALQTLWDGIKENAKTVLKLVFGEDDEGGIKWPSGYTIWSKVKDGLEKLWDGIKTMAKTVLKLAFGEADDGGIKWPSKFALWNKIKDGLGKLWDGIKDLAKGTLKLIFGETEDGGIRWKSAAVIWRKIKGGLSTLWSDIKGFAKNILKLVFGEDDEGGIQWPTASKIWSKIKGGLETFWSGVQDNAKGILKLAFGSDNLTFDSANISEKISDWWTTATADVGNLFTKVFNIPTWDQIILSFNENVNSIIKGLNEMFGLNIGYVGQDFTKDVTEKIDAQEQLGLRYAERLEQIQKAYGDGAIYTQAWEQTVSALTSMFPEMESFFQNENGLINVNTETLQENIKAWADRSRQQALSKAMLEEQERLAEVQSAQVKAELDYQTAQNRLNDYGAKAVSIYEKLRKNTELAKTGIKVGDVDTSDITSVIKEITAVENKLNMLRISDKTIAQILGLNWEAGELTEFRQTIGDFETLTGNVSSAKQELDRANASLEVATERFKQYSTSVKAMMDAATSSTDGLTESVRRLQNTLGTSGIGSSVIDPLSRTTYFTHSKGLNYVPYDGYRAILHRGETILNQDQGRDWRQNNGGFNAQQLYATVASAVAAVVGDIQINMNGKAVANAVSGQVSRNLYQDALGRRYAPV